MHDILIITFLLIEQHLKTQQKEDKVLNLLHFCNKFNSENSRWGVVD